MLTDLYDPEAGDETLDDDLGPRGAGALSAPQDDGDADGAVIPIDPVEAVQAEDAGEDTPVTVEPEPQPDPVAVTDEPAANPPAALWPPAPMAVEDIDVAQLFRDRPDVFQGFFSEFYGPNNDHHSSAWNDRVGGDTPEDYARYWYKTYGANEGYVPTALARPAASPVEPEAPAVRTTADGIPLDQILRDRPDVFQGFFTEFYGPNNDHHSSAWNNRVGGSTPQDYANYWYETYGKAAGYGAQPPASPEEEDDGASGEASPFDASAGDQGIFLLT